MTEVYSWDALMRPDYFVDYQNLYTFCGVMSQRGMFVTVAREMMKAGRNDRAVEMLDKCQLCVPDYNFPLDMTYLGFSNEQYVLQMISLYFELGEAEKGMALAEKFTDELMTSANFFLEYYSYAQEHFEDVRQYVLYVAYILQDNGKAEKGKEIEERFNSLLSLYGGEE